MSTQPKNAGVEAGDRALETARNVHAKCYLWSRMPVHNITSAEQITEIAAEVQSAMNAQEREWRESIAEWRSALMHAWANDHRAVMTALLEIGPAERLLAERGGKQ